MGTKERHRTRSQRTCLLLVFALLVAGIVIRGQAQSIEKSASVPDASPSLGPADAPVTIVEFSDFQCPFCRQAAPVVRELVSAYPGKVRFVFRHSPLSIHPKAVLAHEAALAAGAQGKFWEMHDLLFANQRNLGSDDLVRYAQQLGLNAETFRRALDQHQFRPEVERDRAEAQRLGITGTPTFLIAGRQYRGALTRNELDSIIAAELHGASSAGASDNPADLKLDRAPAIGPNDADVTVVVFSDFACPYSRAMAGTLAELRHKYPERVRVAFKHFPRANNDAAFMAHQLAVAAAEQGKFWEWHERMFALRGDLRRDRLMEAAEKIGLQRIDWKSDHPPDAFSPAVDADLAEGRRLGVRGTPTLFVNGTKIQGAQPLSVLEGIVAAELERAARKRRPPATARESRLARGPVDASVLIVWYSDVQSPLSPKTADLLEHIQRAFPNRVRVVFRHRPLDSHPQARLAHEALAIAAEHDKFWEMLALLHSRQSALDERALASCAKRIGLNGKEFLAALQAGEYRAAVEQDVAEARRLDIRGIPVLFVNDKRIEGLLPDYQLRQIIEAKLRTTKIGAPSGTHSVR